MGVKVWAEEVVIPTYEVGPAEKNPMFLEKRVYQGSSGVVYPYPVIEHISDQSTPVTYQALWLENEYLKIMILPELGGRVQMAYDKIKERHFVYYNQVIKPALVGLAGPWISGGIEFNWPQHHRPSTFMPIDWTIEEHPDGGATVWVSERERMFHQRGAAGFTLRPNRAVLEIQGKVYNPTPIPQTFLWWANPAVAVNDHYQSVFPSDVHAVFDHGKRDVSEFPIAKGVYYKMDYAPGTDISRYSNIPVPTSYMAIESRYNFVGGYENDTQGGLLHVANHHISPGKKQWTWGYGDFGVAWDRNLTDVDGPYIELMTGVYTDNQPDFSWLQPYEEKTFTQYFMPYRELGVVKNASADLMLNLEVEQGTATIKVFATSPQNGVLVLLRGKEVHYEKIHNLSPEEVLVAHVEVGDQALDSLELQLIQEGRVVLGWRAETAQRELPQAAAAALLPAQIASCEELYLTGLHLEQYRHATYNPTDYYQEALTRDPLDVRNNNAMGLWLFRRGKFADAEPYFCAAIKRQIERNPNPYDGEPLYNLGLSLKFQGKLDDAYQSFYKACWNSAWQDSGYFSLAQISSQKGDFVQALDQINKSLNRNGSNMLALHLKVAILRQLDQKEQALVAAQEALAQDRFNFGAIYEQYLITGDVRYQDALLTLMRDECHNYCELALDYLGAGCNTEAIGVLELAIKACAKVSPMVYYYMGYAGRREAFDLAARCDAAYCFPNRLEAILALEMAIKHNPRDAKALYYLGNLWYDKRQYTEAIGCWEQSVACDGTFPTAKRNLALAYFNKLDRQSEAIALLEEAFALDSTDTRILMELDQLYKRVQRPHSERKAFLDRHRAQIDGRDDLYLEYATLLNQLGQYQEAKVMIDKRQFHPWEGGEGKVPTQYQFARVELAKQALSEQRWGDVIELLEQCYVYPHNLGEGKLQGAQENDFNYWLGCAYEGLGELQKATNYFELAVQGLSEPCDAIYYNDQKPDKIFYQGLALLKLGQQAAAQDRFARLVAYGAQHQDKEVRLDYFAVSLPDLLIWQDDLNLRNQIHCLYMMALGHWGLGARQESRGLLERLHTLETNHQGIQAFVNLINLDR